DAGTATRSPTAGIGRRASRTSTSPDSQNLPAMATVALAGSFARLASSGVYTAPYAVGRMLSAIPPSTATYVRTPSITLTHPTRYSAIPAGPAIERPGSMVSVGGPTPRSAAASQTVAAIACVTSEGGIGASESV